MKFLTFLSALALSASTFAMTPTDRNLAAINFLLKNSVRVVELESKHMLSSIEIMGSDSSKVTLKLTYIRGMGENDKCSLVQFVVLPETQNIMAGNIPLDNCQK